MYPAETADRRLDVGGTVLRYRDEGVGPAVVLVHGWTLDLDLWEPQVQSLRAAFRVIRLDRRGHGLSQGRPSLDDDVADIVELLRRLNVQRFAMVGMSQGARVALKIAGIAPERITALILDGPPFIEAQAAAGPPEIPYDQYRAIAQTKGLRAFRRAWGENPLTQLRSPDPQIRALLDKILDRYPGHDLTEANAPAPFAIDWSNIARHAVPTLIISGEHDLKTRQQSAQWLATHLGAERRQIPNAAHLGGLDNPSVYNRAVQDFLDRHAK